MEVKVTKVTNIELARKCIETSVYSKDFKSKLTDLSKIYFSEHSPMYSQIYMVELIQIPYFVHTHLRTHKSHFITETVTTGRLDMGADENEYHSTDYRHRPVNMLIMCNSKVLVDISRKRLCNKADIETRTIWNEVKNRLIEQNDCLARFMVPQCIYRGGICPEVFGTGCCGFNKTRAFRSELIKYLGDQRSNYTMSNHLEDMIL